MTKRPNRWPEAKALIEAAGVATEDVRHIEITPNKVAVTVMLRDEQGSRYIVGDEVAADVLVFPCLPDDE